MLTEVTLYDLSVQVLLRVVLAILQTFEAAWLMYDVIDTVIKTYIAIEREFLPFNQTLDAIVTNA